MLLPALCGHPHVPCLAYPQEGRAAPGPLLDWDSRRLEPPLTSRTLLQGGRVVRIRRQGQQAPGSEAGAARSEAAPLRRLSLPRLSLPPRADTAAASGDPGTWRMVTPGTQGGAPLPHAGPRPILPFRAPTSERVFLSRLSGV